MTTTATIEADPTVPIIRITRDFATASAQLFQAHTARLFANWVGPDRMTTTVNRRDARLEALLDAGEMPPMTPCPCP